jgi:hypothetical protein
MRTDQVGSFEYQRSLQHSFLLSNTNSKILTELTATHSLSFQLPSHIGIGANSTDHIKNVLALNIVQGNRFDQSIPRLKSKPNQSHYRRHKTLSQYGALRHVRSPHHPSQFKAHEGQSRRKQTICHGSDSMAYVFHRRCSPRRKPGPR